MTENTAQAIRSTLQVMNERLTRIANALEIIAEKDKPRKHLCYPR